MLLPPCDTYLRLWELTPVSSTGETAGIAAIALRVAGNNVIVEGDLCACLVSAAGEYVMGLLRRARLPGKPHVRHVGGQASRKVCVGSYSTRKIWSFDRAAVRILCIVFGVVLCCMFS
jgi:hypothetical protein